MVTVKDKSLLFIAMLREAEIEAHPSLIGVSRRELIKDIPTMQFNHCIVVARIEGNYRFLDPIAETCAYGYLPAVDQNKTLMVFFNDVYRFLKTPLFKATDNRETRETVITINMDRSINVEKIGRAYGELTLQLSNYFQHQKPTVRKEILERKISQFCPCGVLTDYSFSSLDSVAQPFTISQKFHVDDRLHKIGNEELSLRLPAVSINILGIDKSLRRYPIEYYTTESKKYNIIVNLPQGVKPITFPQSISLKNDYAEFLFAIDGRTDVIVIKISYIHPPGFSFYYGYMIF